MGVLWYEVRGGQRKEREGLTWSHELYECPSCWSGKNFGQSPVLRHLDSSPSHPRRLSLNCRTESSEEGPTRKDSVIPAHVAAVNIAVGGQLCRITRSL